MGQIQPPPPPQATASTDELPAYDEIAQPYTDHDNDTVHALSPASTSTAYEVPGQQNWHSVRGAHRSAGSLSLYPTFSTDPVALETLIAAQTRLPPRPCLVIHGHHQESRRNGKETKTETVTDFDFRIDLTRTILRWGRDERDGPAHRWSYTTVVSDGDGQKAYRGGRIPSRAKKTGYIALPDDEDEGERLMDLENADEYPGIKGWCERFCADSAPVKSFTYRRNLHGFDAAPMRAALTSHIRSTGYRGTISISPAVANGFVTFYSPHWINRLRNNGFVYWVCIVLQLWLITWPVIWFLERRYEVVRSEWFTSQTVVDSTQPGGSGKVYAGGHSEEAAAELWAPVVREAAWQRMCHGEILGEAEVVQLRRQGIQRREAVPGQAQDLLNRGQVVLGAIGVRNIGGVDVTGGWGGDNSSSSSSWFGIRMG